MPCDDCMGVGVIRKLVMQPVAEVIAYHIQCVIVRKA